MKIFISWSGERSEALAKALKDWLPLVLHYADPWLSRSDIDAGDRWGVEIAKGLEACNFGIICVTRENKDAPWILFEAGALAKSMQDGKVIPLLLGIDNKEISGPLAQFQAKKAEKNEIGELITSLNRSAENQVADANLDKLFEMLWPDLERKIRSIPENTESKKPARPVGEILEELVAGFRSLEGRFLSTREGDQRELTMRLAEEMEWLRRRAPRSRFLQLMKAGGPNFGDPDNPLQILIAGSLFREEAPWLYDLVLDAYRAVKSGDIVAIMNSRKALNEAFQVFGALPIAEEIGPDWRRVRSVILECLKAATGRAEWAAAAQGGPDSVLERLGEELEARSIKKPQR